VGNERVQASGGAQRRRARQAQSPTWPCQVLLQAVCNIPVFAHAHTSCVLQALGPLSVRVFPTAFSLLWECVQMRAWCGRGEGRAERCARGGEWEAACSQAALPHEAPPHSISASLCTLRAQLCPGLACTGSRSKREGCVI